MKKLIIIIYLFSFYINGIYSQDKRISDKNATSLTIKLFNNLSNISKKHIMFGQHDATQYGHSWKDEENRSDVKDVLGTHPAVIGTDFAGVTASNPEQIIESQQRIIKIIQDTYKRGGITTICWHSRNPANDGSYYYDKNPVEAINQMLPGGMYHEKFNSYLDRIAEIAKKSCNDKGENIPFIFRPFHEFDGDWFWWGYTHCTQKDFVAIWQYMVNYLRNEKKIHSIIYAFSPDCRFNTKDEYLKRYPGDEYVDLLGVDDYWDFRPDGANNPKLAKKKLRIVSSIAKEKGKLVAFTETGLEGVKQTNWYTKVLLPILKDKKTELAYILVWRNAFDIPTHYYTPFKGHKAEQDFKNFYKDGFVLFEDKLPDMYK